MDIMSLEEKTQYCKDANSFQINNMDLMKIHPKSLRFVCVFVVVVVLQLDILILSFITEIKRVK